MTILMCELRMQATRCNQIVANFVLLCLLCIKEKCAILFFYFIDNQDKRHKMQIELFTVDYVNLASTEASSEYMALSI